MTGEDLVDDGTAVAGTVGLPSRSALTRAKLVRVAERLFADQGFQAVSLNEINRAAQQRHRNACQYHFGNKDGLIQAILDKHVPTVAQARARIFDRLEAAGAVQIEDVVAALVRPVAAKLVDPDGGKEFVRLNAQLIVAHTVGALNGVAISFRAPDTERLGQFLQSAMAPYHLPEHTQRQRMLVIAGMLFHGLADHSRVLEAESALDEQHVSAFSENLEAMILAAMIAPTAQGVSAHG